MQKASHRKGLSLTLEYGEVRAQEIKQKIKERVRQVIYGEFEKKCYGCKITFYAKTNGFVKYCSDECKKKYGVLVITNCKTCSKEVKTKNKTKQNNFCSRNCYYSWLKVNVKPPQSELRRINANSADAIKKRRKTNLESGLWNDYDVFIEGKNYKQYVSAVRGVTRRLRKEFYELWDGYDHYDGEYIKNNFSLPITHGDYPSIDHKVSCTEGFRNKIPPKELCKFENLVVTKKRINASKRNKQYQKFKTTGV